MPTKTRITAAPMHSHPCPACGRRTRHDGYCRTAQCPNRVPDDLIRPVREQALADMRATLAAARARRTDKDTPDD